MALYHIPSKSKGMKFGYTFWFLSLWKVVTLVNEGVHKMRL